MHLETLHCSTGNFRIEDQLLLYGVRTDETFDFGKQIEALSDESINWESIIKKAVQHGVMPLLYQNLNKCPQSVPTSTLEKLRKLFYLNARRNLCLSQELLKVLDGFNKRGISAVPFKGPCLAEAIYGDISLRQFSDIDILIKERDVPRAREMLISQGYRPDPVHQLDFEAHYACENKGSVVDLHWAISHKNVQKKRDVSFAIDLEQVWERMGQTTFLEATIPQFSREDMFIIRCQDAVKEYWKDIWPQLKWVHDIAQMVQVHVEMDWEWVIEQAARFGNQRLISLCLSLAESLMGTPLPEAVRPWVSSDSQVKELTAEAHRMFFCEGVSQNPFLDKHRGFFRRDLFCIKLKERFKDRIPYYLRILRNYRKNARKALKNKEDRSYLLLPGCLSYLYYIFFMLYYTLRPAWREAKSGLKAAGTNTKSVKMNTPKIEPSDNKNKDR